MRDMICRKSLMACQTPGMCSPHGGCHEPTFNPDWNRLESAQESLREHMQIITHLKAENEALRKALTTIREESHDIGACECAADALVDSRKVNP